MPNTAEVTARTAENDQSNSQGMCLQQCRLWAGIPAKYPDATTAARHAGVRPGIGPRGSFAYWTGGSRGHGHIAVNLGGGKVRSTDWPSSGRVGTTTVGAITSAWRLKYVGWSWSVNDQEVVHAPVKPPAPPKPAPVPEGSVVVRCAHISMQFSDNASQKKADAEKVFAREKERGARWVTGTEGWETDTHAILQAAAKKHGFRFWRANGQDSWIAVRETFIKNGWSTHYEKVLDGVKGRNTSKGVLAVSFNTVALGRVTVMASHFLTKGDPSRDPAPFLADNKKLSREIGNYAVKAGAGTNLVFYGGDQNIQDNKADTFLGAPLTSLQDELKKYESTGHGPIDVIASYDKDGRVKGRAINALPDSEFPLFTDHFLVEGSFEVRKL